MKWHQIRQLYLSACGNTPAAASESLLHLTEGARQVFAKLDVQEIEETDTERPVVTDDEYIEMPEEMESVTTIFNVTTGEKLEAEPTGMRGRSAFIEPLEGKPAPGVPQFWVVSNGRIYLRPRADDAYLLRLLGRRKAIEVTNDLMNVEPGIPEQYHMAIVQTAAVSFLSLHPDVAASVGAQVLPGLQQALSETLFDKPTPKERESNDRRFRVYIPMRFKSGY